MNHDGLSITAMIVLASFAIERLKAGLLFLVSSPGGRLTLVPDPATLKDEQKRARAQRMWKIVEFAIAGVLALLALELLPGIRILHALGAENSVLDFPFTWLVLTAGADRLADLLKSGDESPSSVPASQPIVITGDLRLVDSNEVAPRVEAAKRAS